MIFTPDNHEIIDKIYELGGYKNEENKTIIFLSMNSIFQSQKHSHGSKQMHIKTRHSQKNQDAWMRRRLFFIIFN